MFKKIIIILVICLAFIFESQSLRAEEVSSPSYIIKGLTVGEGGNGNQSSTSYGLLANFSGNLNDVRFSSTSYKIGVGEGFVLMANVPTISCFETTSAGSTSCIDSKVNPGGMVKICGDGGCYNRARFEINSQLNPSDTLYSAQLTTDPTWATYNYIDGTNFTIETISTHDLNDYQTKATWEGTASGFNLFGLASNTTYYLRLTALHGDFTESGTSPAVSALTGQPQISFDIDIAPTSGSGTETNSPYIINMGSLSVDTITTATDLVWLDLGTNLSGGVKVFVRDQYSGLYSASKSYTLTSTTNDLTSLSGYGLKQNSVTQTYLGPMVVTAKYDGFGNNVGSIANNIYSEMIYNTSGSPVYQGRMSLFVKAKPNESTPNAGDFTDTLYFTVSGSY